MNRLLGLEKHVVRWARAIAFVGLIGLLVMALAILADVTLRWLVNVPIPGLEDLNGVLISIVVASFFPALLIERKNVSLELFGLLVAPARREWFNSFGHLVTLFFIAVIAWQLVLHAGSVADQETLILRLPTAPGWWFAAALFALCVPVQLLVFVVHLARAVTGRPEDGA